MEYFYVKRILNWSGVSIRFKIEPQILQGLGLVQATAVEQFYNVIIWLCV